MSPRQKRVFTYILIPLIFAAVATALWMMVGRSFTKSVYATVQMMVVKGQPGYGDSYTEDSAGLLEKGEIKKSEITLPGRNQRYGKLLCNEVDLKTPIYYGDTDKVLDQGAGIYTGSGLFGEGRTILISAHDNTYFAPVEKLKKGMKITVLVPYGKYTYEVTGMKVVKESNTKAAHLDGTKEELVLYTCYPFGENKNRDQRYFVYAKKVSGPVIKEDS